MCVVGFTIPFIILPKKLVFEKAQIPQPPKAHYYSSPRIQHLLTCEWIILYSFAVGKEDAFVACQMVPESVTQVSVRKARVPVTDSFHWALSV